MQPAQLPLSVKTYWILTASVLAIVVAAVWAGLSRDVPVLTVADNSRTLILTKKGHLMGADDLPATTRERMRAMLASGRLPLSDLERDSRSGAAGSESVTLISPVDEVVLPDNVRFRWILPKAGGTSTLRIMDRSGAEVENAKQLQVTEIRSEADFHAGEQYLWKITTSSGIESPVATFRVATAATQTGLKALENAKPRSHVAFAAEYAAGGLRLEALREVEALRRENPASPLPAQLAASVIHGRQ